MADFHHVLYGRIISVRDPKKVFIYFDSPKPKYRLTLLNPSTKPRKSCISHVWLYDVIFSVFFGMDAFS
jgi:hypothetical protein